MQQLGSDICYTQHTAVQAHTAHTAHCSVSAQCPILPLAAVALALRVAALLLEATQDGRLGAKPGVSAKFYLTSAHANLFKGELFSYRCLKIVKRSLC